jgi:hypothetical protein
MRVMVLIKADAKSEAGVLPDEQLLADMGRFNEELAAAGLLRGGDGLQPSSKGARVRFQGSSRVVTHGPFAETGELVAGYWLWEVASLDEAIEWVKRIPCPMSDDQAEVEIRPLFEMEDFGEAFTPELREREARLRAELA